MTMDNGEGRPLDEAESGNEDPQGWYFDLPGGAWERQEEKNRTLRQRVLGNLSEDEAKAKSDPFGRKSPEPEKKSGRGFFGRRKQEEESAEKTSAGGTWILNRGGQETAEPHPAPDPLDDLSNDTEDDEWTTEPPLKLSAFPHAERHTQPEWGESDGGWDLSRPEDADTDDSAAQTAGTVESPDFELEHADTEPIPFPSVADLEPSAPDESDGTEDFLASMRSWAQEQPETETAARPAPYRVPAIEDLGPGFGQDEVTADADDSEEPPAYFAPIADVSEPEPEPDLLTLRPRRRESDGKELDWNFGPAAWSDGPGEVPSRTTPEFVEPDAEPVFQAPDADADAMGYESTQNAPEFNREQAPPFHGLSAEPEAVAGTGDAGPDVTFEAADDGDSAETADEMSFESMRKWAERNRDKDHPHFRVAHNETEEAQGAPGPAPIPLRPRASDEGATAASNLLPKSEDAPQEPIQIPIVLRSRTEPQPEPVDPETPSKWNDFFAITPTADTGGAEGEEEGPSEGLAAMRAWAQKRAEPESPQDIPEEFLKPFDWELEEDGEPAEASLSEVPAEMLKPFAWEAEDADAADEQIAAFEEFQPAAAEDAVFEPEELVTDPTSVPETASRMASPFGAELEHGLADESAGEDDDPLDGLFPAAPEPATREEKKKPGRFGRLFGRGKGKQPEPEIALPVDAGDWELPVDGANGDIRVAARVNDWTEDAGTLQAADLAPQQGEGWGASLTSGWANSDKEAISEFSSSVFNDAQDAPAGHADNWEPEASAESFSDAVGISEPAGVEAAEGPAWAPETVVPSETDPTFAFAETKSADEDVWNPEPVETADFASPAPSQPMEASQWAEDEGQSSFEAFEWSPEPEVEAPVEAAASVDAVVEEPVAEKAWWEAAAADDQPEFETPVEAVASVDTVVEEPVAENAWWEAAAADQPEVEAPVEAVASVDAVVEEPVAEKAWWEAAPDEPEVEAPVEAVASVDTVVEEPVAENAWWEAAAADQPEFETPVEAVASVDAVVEEPVAEKAWWEAAANDDEPDAEAPLEAIASVDAVVEEPVAEKAWWEAPAADDQPEVEAPVEAVASVDVVEEPVAEKAWWEATAADDQPEFETPVEAVASVDSVVEEPVAEKAWWEAPATDEPEVEAPVEAVASVDAVVEEPVAEKAWWEAPAADEPDAEAPIEAVASVDAVVEEPVAEKTWWEAAPDDHPEVEAPVEAVASVDAVVEEPVAEKAWWEAAAADDQPEVEVPVEAVASVDAVVEEPVAEKAWWEAPAADDQPEVKAPVEAVASVDAVVEEPVAEKAWWEAAAADDQPEVEVPVEAVASVDAVVEEPVAEKAWWEAPAADDQPEVKAPVEAVASVDAVVEEPVAEKAWWEAAAGEDQPEVEAPVEAVASEDAVAEEPVAEKAWWEAAAVDEPDAEAPVEAVASVDAVVEEPVAEKAWWEAPAADDQPEVEAPVEAVASVDVVEEPVAEKAWWEAPAADDEPEVKAPVEAVASVDAVVEEPVAEKAWWEAAAADEPEAETPVEAVSSVDTVVEEPFAELSIRDETAMEVPAQTAASIAEPDDDDPWADFVSAPAGAANPEPVTESAAWRHEPVRPPADEDMWSHIADQAEEAAASDPHQIDLAASLESQMAERPEPAYRWSQPEEDEWEAAQPDTPAPFAQDHEEDDVILAAFERHAATPDAVSSRENDEAFAELLGTEAADIVAEADDEDAGKQSFIKMTGWAPQRGGGSFDGGWAPEQEVEEALSGTRHSAFGGSDGAGFAPPPWAVEELESDGESQTSVHGHHRTKTWIRELVETGLLALLVFLSVRASFQNFKVEGSSMYPTLENGQFLIVNKLVYSEVDMDKLSSYVPFVDAGSDPKRQVFHGPERGDIIVLKDPRNTETDLIKRVIGLPGETIEIVDGKVYINDQLLDEPYIKAVWHDTKPKIAIPPGEFFVMGDNRDNSLDSRSSQVGLVPQDLIIGKAMLSYWPREKFGLAPNEEGTLGDQKPVLTTQRIGGD